MLSRVSIVVLLALVCVSVLAASEAGHGWGDKIEWHSWEQAKQAAASSGKPIMYARCRDLGPLAVLADRLALALALAG